MKNVVTFVSVLVVDIYWGVLLVNDRSFNDLQPFILFAISRTVPRTASLYQLPNVDKANADSGLRERLNFCEFWLHNMLIL